MSASAARSLARVTTAEPRITRRHRAGDCRSSTVFSRCGAYRFALNRDWGPGGRIAFVMLNPSTADHRRNDPTIARCEIRARDMGLGALRIVNLFAWRATRPAGLRAAADPVGPGNDACIRRAALWADLVLCAWGADGQWLGRAAQVEALLRACGRPLFHLGLTQAGAPRHPLYRPRLFQPIKWD